MPHARQQYQVLFIMSATLTISAKISKNKWQKLFNATYKTTISSSVYDVCHSSNSCIFLKWMEEI